MFFLLRVAFWLGLALVLLPTDRSSDTDKSDKARADKMVEKPFDAMAAATAAAATMSDMSQFCVRQPAACEAGGKAAVAIGERAQNGARKVYQFINERRSDGSKSDGRKPDHTGSIGALEGGARNTLTAEDLEIEWQAPRHGSSQRRD